METLQREHDLNRLHASSYAARPTNAAGVHERQSSVAELGRMMRAERERHGLTHDQFAQALGIESSDIVWLERGVL
ncbi:helix-turn-helix domain-containing protein (plasmid) [Cupriavidus pauculus]|uniref:Helix-turn-helix domain-containing protein n=1 Tax=Cupriavidus pauculus TaxID=82633 RepID=A0A5P2H6W8_9BURK|nr:helix-turn-helix transcriptional regulator [Cupriavidus pauculus]QET03927.1 helix-turn-helix domain-containing protein [Cupriavidus pauculus]